METSVALWCSPVARSMSSSRGSGSSVMAAASWRSSSVVSPIAETTTTRFAPVAFALAIRPATCRIRAASASEEPPNFCTTSGPSIERRSLSAGFSRSRLPPQSVRGCSTSLPSPAQLQVGSNQAEPRCVDPEIRPASAATRQDGRFEHRPVLSRAMRRPSAARDRVIGLTATAGARAIGRPSARPSTPPERSGGGRRPHRPVPNWGGLAVVPLRWNWFGMGPTGRHVPAASTPARLRRAWTRDCGAALPRACNAHEARMRRTGIRRGPDPHVL